MAVRFNIMSIVIIAEKPSVAEDLANVGVSGVKHFEDELFDAYGIPSHMCDFSSDIKQFKTPLKDGQTFKKRWLDVEGKPNSITL